MLVPTSFYQNYRIAFSVPELAFKPSDGYTLHLTLVGPAEFQFTGTHVSNQYNFDVLVTESGLYQYCLYAEKDDARTLIETGRCDVQTDPLTITTGTELRTHAEKMLDAIEAVLEKRATSDQQSYSIAGRSITRIPIAELMQWRDKYRAEVRSKKKSSTPRGILVQFGRR